MAETSNLKYDVAISFLARDSELAGKIADRLNEFCKVFCYHRSQEEVAGTDGMDTFRQVFRFESRLVIVLHRDNWGQTPWTRVESEAIKERSLKEGWDFLLMVKLEQNQSYLTGFPETRIYIDYEQYGFEQTIGAIKAALQRQGGLLKIESSIDRAKRLAQNDNYRKEREKVLSSCEGVNAAKGLVSELFQSISSQAVDVQSALPNFQVSCTNDIDYLVLRIHHRDAVSLGVQWQQHYGNSLEGSELLIGEVQGLLVTRSERSHGYYTIDSPKTIRKYSFLPEYSLSRDWVWKEKRRDGRIYSSPEMAEHVIKSFLELVERVSKGELRYSFRS